MLKLLQESAPSSLGYMESLVQHLLLERGPPMNDPTVLSLLFLSALVAATVLPMQSEAVLVGLLLAWNY